MWKVGIYFSNQPFQYEAGSQEIKRERISENILHNLPVEFILVSSQSTSFTDMSIRPSPSPSNKYLETSDVSASYGERLLPQVLDELAWTEPNRIYASCAVSTDLSRAFFDVKMIQMAFAVDYVAWWMKDLLGHSGNFETLAYMGLSDLRYPIVCLAGIKCGWKVSLELDWALCTNS